MTENIYIYYFFLTKTEKIYILKDQTCHILIPIVGIKTIHIHAQHIIR
jgi:hypothetical protein